MRYQQFGLLETVGYGPWAFNLMHRHQGSYSIRFVYLFAVYSKRKEHLISHISSFHSTCLVHKFVLEVLLIRVMVDLTCWQFIEVTTQWILWMLQDHSWILWDLLQIIFQLTPIFYHFLKIYAIFLSFVEMYSAIQIRESLLLKLHYL